MLFSTIRHDMFIAYDYIEEPSAVGTEHLFPIKNGGIR